MDIIEIDIKKLIGYEKNNRNHPPEQVRKLAASIKEFGFDVPLLVTEDNIIIAGHGRKLAAEQLGMKKVPCVISSLDEIKARARRIVDNTIPQEAESLLNNLVSETIFLDDAGYDLSTYGLERFLGDLVENPDDEWNGMPDFKSDDQTPFKSLKVNFECQEDVVRFSQLTGQNITKDTRSIWYPFQERENVKEKLYMNEV